MSRRSRDGAAQAAQAASDAARVLQQRSQEVRSESASAATEPSDSAPKGDTVTVRTVTPRNEPRRRAMEEIEARDLKTKGMELPGIQPEPETAKDKPAEELAPAKAEDTAPAAPAAPAEPQAPAAQPEAPATVRVKVDGEEFDAPADEVEAYGGVKAYQIQKASENRLKKANETLAEARRVQQALIEVAMRAQQPQQPQAPQQPQITDDQFIASKLDEIRFGTPEQGAAALREVMQRTSKQIDPQAIIEQAANKIKHDQAVAAFDREFTDIAANPMLLKLVVALRNERIAKVNGPIDWDSFYRTIGNDVRSVAGRPSQPATAPAAQAAPATSGTPSQATSEKEARKASIVNLPTAQARAELPKESKPESREDVLQQMRKARGLPTG